MLSHLPLTAAVAAMVSLVAHAHDGRTPAAAGWILCAGAAVALACLGLGAARPPPLILGLALVLLLAIPWGLAVVRRLTNAADSPTE